MDLIEKNARRIAAEFGLSRHATRFLIEFARHGEQASIHQVLGCPSSELPAINSAMSRVTEWTRSHTQFAGVR